MLVDGHVLGELNGGLTGLRDRYKCGGVGVCVRGHVRVHECVDARDVPLRTWACVCVCGRMRAVYARA